MHAPLSLLLLTPHHLFVAGVEFGSGTPLHKAYSCPSDVGGFDHTELKAAVEKGRKDLPFDLPGQYEFERVTSEAVLASVQVGRGDIPPESVATMPALPGGTRRLDAVVVWVEFEHGELSFTTFDEYHGQRVVFLNEVRACKESARSEAMKTATIARSEATML